MTILQRAARRGSNAPSSVPRTTAPGYKDSFEYRRGIRVSRRNTGHDNVPHHRPLLVSLPLWSPAEYCAVSVSAVLREEDGRTVKPVQQPEPLGDELVTRHAVCRSAEESPVLDGKLDDRCWQKAAVIDHFATFWTVPKSPRQGTLAYLVWDDNALYYAGSMIDAELRAFGTRRNDSLWNVNVFELFLKPSVERPEYYEFQANPCRIVFKIAFPKRGHQFTDGFTNAPPLGSRAVVALNGTLDQPGDKD